MRQMDMLRVASHGPVSAGLIRCETISDLPGLFTHFEYPDVTKVDNAQVLWAQVNVAYLVSLCSC